MSSQSPNSRHFIDVQYQFARHIRDPNNHPLPEAIEPRRMAIYKQLFYNNIEGFIAHSFPVLRRIFTDDAWHSMIRDFMKKHHCKTPLFHEIAAEFLSYLDHGRDTSSDPSFINELAHYEWVELALSVLDDDPNPEAIQAGDDSMLLPLKTSALAWPLTYQYPVHQISPSFQPQHASPSPIHLLVYRNQQDSVTFLELNPVSARLIALLNKGLTGDQAAQQICQELQHSQPHVVRDGAQSLIDNWIDCQILIYSN